MIVTTRLSIVECHLMRRRRGDACQEDDYPC
jgi:hypothetical protein